MEQLIIVLQRLNLIITVHIGKLNDKLNSAIWGVGGRGGRPCRSIVLTLLLITLYYTSNILQ